MDQLTNDNAPKRKAGGDQHTPAVRIDIASREEEIVAMRLRGSSFSEIAWTVGVSKQAVQKAFIRALSRNTDKTIQEHHRSVLAELELEQATAWQILDATKERPNTQLYALSIINRIHVRRARLLGLDAP